MVDPDTSSVKSFATVDAAQTTGLEGDSPKVDEAYRRLVVRKIDRVLMPLMFVTYCLNFADKTVLSSASVSGLIKDTVRASYLINSSSF